MGDDEKRWEGTSVSLIQCCYRPLLAVCVYVKVRRLSVRLSVPSIDSSSDVQLFLLQLGRLRQISIDSCRSPAPERSIEGAASYAVIRGSAGSLHRLVVGRLTACMHIV